MTTVNLTIQLRLDEDDISLFKGADLFVIPYLPEEGEGILAAMAALERFVEGAGNAGAIAAFQAVGEFFARARVTGTRRADA